MQAGAFCSWAAQVLREAGSPSPRLDADLLLAHVLGVNRAALLTHPEWELSEAQWARATVLVERRAEGEPIAYLRGERDWYDLTVRVSPDVLVPRPETEGLLEKALDFTRQRQAAGRPVQRVADVGTGSGILALALARTLPDAHVYALDLSPAALAVARENAARLLAASRAITFLESDLLDALPEQVDLIVANLPYIGREEYASLAPDVRLYEPRLALVGGDGGHELSVRLLDTAPGLLRAGGALYIELGPPQAAPSLDAARRAFPSASISLSADLAGLTRYLSVELPYR